MQEKEKRKVAFRKATEAVIACRRFTSSGTTHTVDGIMRNYSEEGSYIETSRKFKLGAILFLRMVHYPLRSLSVAAEELPRSICVAEVKWWKEMAIENTIRYGFGLRYLD